MGDSRVYLVRYARTAEAPDLTVAVDGNSVPMAEFVQTHVPVQVTSLTEEPQRKGVLVGLMIAEEKPAPRSGGTWGRKRQGGG